VNLRDSARDIISQVESLTGYPVEVIEDDALQTTAVVQMASRRTLPVHLVRYKATAGQLPDYLDRLRDVDPTHVNGRVALGVALMRRGDDERGIEALEQAVALEPANPWAQRNLGAALAESGRVTSGIEHLREATGLTPDDDQAWFGLGRALELASDDDEADRAYRRVLEINEFGEVASLARQGLTRIAERVLRANAVDGLRMDAVWYMTDALNAFEGMTPEEVQQVGFECAMLGRRGLDINKSEPKYPLHSLPGEYSALSVVSIMYAAFQQFAPGTDLGIDLAREYEAAMAMRG
jgi:tetratricopeptide (TPR) repeat protein